MNEGIKKALFKILFIGGIFFIIVVVIPVFFIAPKERIETFLVLLFLLGGGVLIFFRIYKKREDEEKRYYKVIVAITGLVLTSMAIYRLYWGSPTSLDKVVYPFIIVVFGLVSILILVNEMALKGTIIDNLCASSQKPGDLPSFVKVHSKECAVKAAPSGYSIYAYGKLYRFDKISNKKIEEFLNKNDSKLEVNVIVKQRDGCLRLVTIDNQQK